MSDFKDKAADHIDAIRKELTALAALSDDGFSDEKQHNKKTSNTLTKTASRETIFIDVTPHSPCIGRDVDVAIRSVSLIDATKVAIAWSNGTAGTVLWGGAMYDKARLTRAVCRVDIAECLRKYGIFPLIVSETELFPGALAPGVYITFERMP